MLLDLVVGDQFPFGSDLRAAVYMYISSATELPDQLDRQMIGKVRRVFHRAVAGNELGEDPLDRPMIADDDAETSFG